LYGSAQLETIMTHSMDDPATKADKFKRYRASQQHKGMRLLRVWVPDPRLASFAVEVERQSALLRGRAEETEALDFIEAGFDWTAP
jgi:hypothetical protein